MSSQNRSAPVAINATRPAVKRARPPSEIKSRMRRENRSTIAPPTKRKSTVGVMRAAANHESFVTLKCVVSSTSRVRAMFATPSPKFETDWPDTKRAGSR